MFQTFQESTRYNLNCLRTKYRRRIRTMMRDLRQGEFKILVAGELSAGKSSFLNALMGEDILPEAYQKSTRMFCEISHHPIEKTAFILRPGGGQAVTLDLSKEEDRSAFQDYVQGIKINNEPPFMPFEKAKIKYPLPILMGKTRENQPQHDEATDENDENGKGELVAVAFVDSPGFQVAEDVKTFHRLAEYTLGCFAFIYVVNMAIPHGVAKKGLAKLMRKVSGMGVHNRARLFNPKSAIFICNKWDVVPEAEEDTVSKDTFERLQDSWPGLQASRVFHVSMKQVKEAHGRGEQHEIFMDVVKSIADLLPNAVLFQIEHYCQWLKHVLDDGIYVCSVGINMKRLYNEPDVRSRRIHEISKSFQNLQEEVNKSQKIKEGALKQLQSILVAEFRGALEADTEEAHALNVWSEAACPLPPGPGRTWDTVKQEINAKLQIRLLEYLHPANNERYCEKIENLKEDFHQSLKQESVRFVDKLQKIESYLLNDPCPKRTMFVDPSDIADLFEESIPETPFTPSLQSLSLHQPQPDPNMQEYMAKCLDNYVERVKTNQSTLLDRLSRHVLQGCRKEINITYQPILQWIDGNLEILRRLKQDETFTESTAKLQEERTRLESLSRQIQTFYIGQVWQHEFQATDIADWPNLLYTTNPVSDGGYRKVYRADILQPDNTTYPVVIKVVKEALGVDGRLPNDLDIYEECERMRQLTRAGCPNFVQYYGSAKYITGDLYYLILVMEWCNQGSLRDVITNDSNLLPGTMQGVGNEERLAGIRYAADYAIQAATAIRYLHDVGLAHRDIKAENFLITETNNRKVVKICDVGEAKRETVLRTGKTGTVLYWAPELWSGGSGCVRYDKSCDIYSFGLLLWELWYGRRVYYTGGGDTFNEERFRVAVVERGWRPDCNGHLRPVAKWLSLMRRCWDAKSDNRPRAKDIVKDVAAVNNLALHDIEMEYTQ
ncbi:uncharacterized protein LOC106156737 isoform X2 [Lingula anatina]|nr:uncharacterized protein LOC106156737 isoform X2 [Lingula anatina]|eukprot:XP_013387596.1 uncharacterized protein LOC106156737 isoform X2 [Lingula anatina]